jgi:hypothetical protein
MRLRNIVLSKKGIVAERRGTALQKPPHRFESGQYLYFLNVKYLYMSNKTYQKLYLEENKVRLVAAQVVVVCAIILLTGLHWLALALAFDFSVRAFTTWPSALGFVAQKVTSWLSLKTIPVFAPPKKFAAGVGVVFSVSIFALLFANYNSLASVVGAVLIFCAVLESVFKFCVGCFVYDKIVAPFMR